jgi:hypothetical protein
VLLGALPFVACSSSDTCQPASPLIFVELPGGTDSISSFAATGACAPAVGGCDPLAASCQTAGCPCQFTVQINPATFDASPNGACRLEVVSKDGRVFSQNLVYTSSGGSCFSVSGPKGTIYIPDFAGAGSADGAAGASGDAGGASGAGGSDGGGSDAPEAGTSDGAAG